MVIDIVKFGKLRAKAAGVEYGLRRPSKTRKYFAYDRTSNDRSSRFFRSNMSSIADHDPQNGASRRRILFLSTLCLVAGLIAGCSTLPSLDNRTISTALSDTGNTRLGRAVSPRVSLYPGKSGLYPLLNARDAFAARVHLAVAAERSLDVQYYIWHKDRTGTLLFEALRRAADREVRVRLLLDDNNTSGLDTTLAALDSHPNIEVRLFNPFAIRQPRWIGYISDFSRLNRRMHNKSFTADNQVAIIGGRNVGDEYFGATDGVLFADLDLMAVGPVVSEVSKDFDRYWASASSYPVDRLLPPAPPALIEEFAEEALLVELDPATIDYRKALIESPFVHELMQHNLPLEWAATRMISDDPAKGIGQATTDALLPGKIMMETIGMPASELDVVSPYFVPTDAGVYMFTALAQRGVKIRVLTNSLEATDVAAVHAGYAKRRKSLLESGITLYEMRRSSSDAGTIKSAGRIGSSSDTSLHAKTFSVDRSHVFVGSFNFDPRSATLNTEMGFVVESPALAQKIEAALSSRMPFNAYQVHLSDTGKLYWTERRNGMVVRYDTEPGTTVWQRVGVWFLSVLPIESLL
jgi:putative cardiolipin synthase